MSMTSQFMDYSTSTRWLSVNKKFSNYYILSTLLHGLTTFFTEDIVRTYTSVSIRGYPASRTHLSVVNPCKLDHHSQMVSSTRWYESNSYYICSICSFHSFILSLSQILMKKFWCCNLRCAATWDVTIKHNTENINSHAVNPKWQTSCMWYTNLDTILLHSISKLLYHTPNMNKKYNTPNTGCKQWNVLQP